MVNFYKDGTARVVIHTANMLDRDWTALTQAIYMTPILRCTKQASENSFKRDFLDYIAYYGAKTSSLSDKVAKYDFHGVKGTLIASVPGIYDEATCPWGLPKLKKVLKGLKFDSSKSDICIAQMSSIATIGQQWFAEFVGILQTSNAPCTARINVIFPTVENIKESLEGWKSGCSVHFKHDSPAGSSLIRAISAYLRKWCSIRAGRDRVAPHIKTYLRTTASGDEIRWMLVTSANMSKQAWGSRENGKWRIKSYECGVLLAAEMFDPSQTEDGEQVRQMKMVPSYKTDRLSYQRDTVNLRMAYDLPTTEYDFNDVIWSPHRKNLGPDWLGQEL